LRVGGTAVRVLERAQAAGLAASTLCRHRFIDEHLLAAFSVGARTFVAAEGVSMYLSAAAVGATLETIREICGSGSVLAMDFWQHPAGMSPLDHARRLGARAIALIGEPVTFALPAAAAAGFLADYRFAAFDLAQSRELSERYATDGRHCDPSLYVLAARL
jgi:O-methyltransferase involved in polyketide biosynthesis